MGTTPNIVSPDCLHSTQIGMGSAGAWNGISGSLEWDQQQLGTGSAGAWNGISGSLERDQQELGMGSAAAWNGISGSLERDQRELGKASKRVNFVSFYIKFYNLKPDAY